MLWVKCPNCGSRPFEEFRYGDVFPVTPDSITDPDGMPYAGQQTSLFERETPRLEGGKQSGAGDSKDEKNDMNPSELSEAEKQRIAAENDKKNFDQLEKEVKEKMQQNPQLDKIKDQVKFIREKDGLRIEVIDKADFSMFGLGTNRMQARAMTLIREVAKSLAEIGRAHV